MQRKANLKRSRKIRAPSSSRHLALDDGQGAAAEHREATLTHGSKSEITQQEWSALGDSFDDHIENVLSGIRTTARARREEEASGETEVMEYVGRTTDSRPELRRRPSPTRRRPRTTCHGWRRRPSCPTAARSRRCCTTRASTGTSNSGRSTSYTTRPTRPARWWTRCLASPRCCVSTTRSTRPAASADEAAGGRARGADGGAAGGHAVPGPRAHLTVDELKEVQAIEERKTQQARSPR